VSESEARISSLSRCAVLLCRQRGRNWGVVSSRRRTRRSSDECENGGGSVCHPCKQITFRITPLRLAQCVPPRDPRTFALFPHLVLLHLSRLGRLLRVASSHDDFRWLGVELEGRGQIVIAHERTSALQSGSNFHEGRKVKKFKKLKIIRLYSFISMDLAHFDAAAFAWPARRPMVVARLPNTGYRGCEGVVKFLGPTAVRKVARRGAPQNVRASIAFSTTDLIKKKPPNK